MTIDITKRIEWLKKRMKMSELEEGYIDMMLKDIATEVAINNNIIDIVSESLPCVMSPECEIIKICADEDVANKEMKEFKKQHGGEWYVDDVMIQK